MMSRKTILISLGALIAMVLLGAFLRHSSRISALKSVTQTADKIASAVSPSHSSPSTDAQDVPATAATGKAGPEAPHSNAYADWDLERLEKEAATLLMSEKLNSKDLPTAEREQLSQLLLALQSARQAKIDAEMQKLREALGQAEEEHQRKLAETREAFAAMRQDP